MMNIKKYSLLLLMCAQVSAVFAIDCQNHLSPSSLQSLTISYPGKSSQGVPVGQRVAPEAHRNQSFNVGAYVAKGALNSVGGALGSAVLNSVGEVLVTVLYQYGMNACINVGVVPQEGEAMTASGSFINSVVAGFSKNLIGSVIG